MKEGAAEEIFLFELRMWCRTPDTNKKGLQRMI